MSIRTRIRTLTYAVLLFSEDNEYNNNHQVDGRSLMFNAIPLLMVGRAACYHATPSSSVAATPPSQLQTAVVGSGSVFHFLGDIFHASGYVAAALTLVNHTYKEPIPS